ncbi:hypothetical protein EDD18DRAFT_1108461 [Armillaria luteobubalina]|uniref:Uncharacterized protein n=1 Tax=Armillaria luteobubalina TaxID=153913 RepID=A0AA39PZ63_9AGAR|nr:hypothetical protein EDD18DRAFT_1108461 [Armillaria luteobubalina]
MTASIGISWEAEDIPLMMEEERVKDVERERESVEVTEWLTKFHQIGIIDRDSILSVLQLPSLTLQDLLSNAGNCKDGKTLSVNDGRVSTYIKEHKIFITMPNGSFIPSPPSPNDNTHPYRNWLDTIWYDIVDADIVHLTGYLTHIGLISQDVHSQFQHTFNYINKRSSAVHSSKQFSEEFDGFLGLHQSNKVAAMQSYWLELVARLDYMDCYQPVMNGKARRDDAPNSSHLMGTFTINLDIAEQHIRAGIPVYLVRSMDQFSNQVILKAEKPVVFPLNTSLPSPPFPVAFKGDPSHPQKFHTMHCFMQIFNTYRNPFNFVTVSQSPVVHTQVAASSSSSTSATSCHLMRNQRGKGRMLGPLASAQASQKKKNNKFTNLVGTYAPPVIPAWADAIAKINKFSERSQECKECSRLAQSQSNKGGAIAPSQDKGYIFPDPALLVYASAARQSSFFYALIYRITSSSSNAKPLRPQLWCELLAMAFKSGNVQGTKAHDLMTQVLGSALEAPSSRTTILQAPAPVCDQPVDIEKGTYFVWELCELNFRQELLSLDMHLTHPDLSAKEEDVINFRLGHQEQIMGLFSDGSLVPSTSTSTNRLALAKGHLGPLGSEVSLKMEAALAAHYAQTFFDVFGWLPDVFPARVLLEAETRYVNILARNRVEKLSICCGWHRSLKYPDEHYTIRGYDHAGWMVVMLEMKAGNVGRWFEYGPRVWRRWLHNARNGRPLMSRHFFRHREHVESLGLENLGSSILSISSSRHTNPSSTMDGVEIEVLVEDLFVGYMIAQLCRPEMAHRRQTEDRFKWVMKTIIYMFVLPTSAGWMYYYIQSNSYYFNVKCTMKNELSIDVLQVNCREDSLQPVNHRYVLSSGYSMFLLYILTHVAYNTKALRNNLGNRQFNVIIIYIVIYYDLPSNLA